MVREILEGSLLYHPVYGLCRVERLIRQERGDKQVLSYLLVPRKDNSMKTRITVAAAGIEESGFHKPVSLKEANEILAYLTTGDATDAPPPAVPKTGYSGASYDRTWDLARAVFSYENTEAKNRIKRPVLERSIKGLVGEFAFVFDITLKKSAEKVQRSLGKKLKTDSLVLDLLSQT